MEAVRYGIVGTGYFGLVLGRAINALPGGSVSLVFDPENGASGADALHARQAHSIDDLCASDEVDAVVVASPNWAHLEPVLAAVANRKHVFCEKPIALSYADCARMVDESSRAGVLFMAGHVTNFMNGVRRAKRLIADGVIGEVVYCRAARTGWEEKQEEVTWKKRRALSGGHLYHHIHELDLVQSIMGPAVEATMIGGNVAHQGPDFGDEDDLLLITLEFGNNTFATLEYGSAFRWPEHFVLIEGTKGAIRIDMQSASVVLRTHDGTQSFLLHRTEEEDRDRAETYRSTASGGAITYGNPASRAPLWLHGIVEQEVEYFHGLLRGAEPLVEFSTLTDGSAATAAIATADALTLSLAEGRKVRVAEITGARPR